MDLKKSKDLLHKHKKLRAVSSSESSSSSDSDSGSSSDSSSSSSSAKKKIKRKGKKVRPTHHSSSSSIEDRARKREKHACHKKLQAKKSHLKKKLKEGKSKKRISSPGIRRRSISPHQKLKKVVAGFERKHHGISSKERFKEKVREREREQEKEREREREKLRIRERERIRSRSPRNLKIKSPKQSRSRELKRKSPIDKHHLSPREKIICHIRRDRSSSERKKELRRHHESRERDRRDRERIDREAARNKEREEALARCQERQRERERLAREKLRRDKEKDYKCERLIPRPADREMALAAARAGTSRERSLEMEHRHGKVIREAIYDRGYERDREYISHEHRIEREDRREHEREYIVVRRREVPSPQGIAHFPEGIRGPEREIYPESQRYERERGYQPRPYLPTGNENHRRDRNWERPHEIPHNHEIDHKKIYSTERAKHPREWEVQENWKGLEPKWEKTWQPNEPPEENWDTDDNYPKKPHLKHDIQVDESLASKTGSRWPQDWHGRPVEERGPQVHGNFRHASMMPPLEYGHERQEGLYRRHHMPPPHIQHSQPINYNLARNIYQPKKQTNFTNTNQLLHPTTTTTSIVPANVTVSTSTVPNLNPVTTNSASNDSPQPAKLPANSQIMVEEPVNSATSVVAEKSLIEQLDVKETEPKLGDKENETVLPTAISPLEETIPDNLSEISDDADDILSKVEDILQTVKENEQPTELPIEDKDKNIDQVDTVEPEVTQETSSQAAVETMEDPKTENVENIEEVTETKDVNDDFLDFEEISDGELEEDARLKNLGDALGVDWASLVEESKNKVAQEKKTTAKERWQPHHVILDVGISVRLAGMEFASKIIKDAQKKLELESIEGEIKHEMKIKSNEEDCTNNQIKEENEMNTSTLDVLACVQVAKRKNLKERRNLVFNACGLHSKALSARKDLEMRRQLCQLPIREVQCSHQVSDSLKARAIKVFQKAIGETR